MIERADEPDRDATDIDALLRRATCATSPRPRVRARSDRRIERFLASTDADATAARSGAAPVARHRRTLLLACGLGLQAAPGVNTVAGPLADLLRPPGVSPRPCAPRSLRCGPAADAWLVTPATAAEHVFRELVPIRARRHADGRTVYEFRSVGDATRYELVSGDGNGLPERSGAARARSTAEGWHRGRPW